MFVVKSADGTRRDLTRHDLILMFTSSISSQIRTPGRRNLNSKEVGLYSPRQSTRPTLRAARLQGSEKGVGGLSQQHVPSYAPFEAYDWCLGLASKCRKCPD